jgi:hypothetical protein
VPRCPREARAQGATKGGRKRRSSSTQNELSSFLFLFPFSLTPPAPFPRPSPPEHARMTLQVAALKRSGTSSPRQEAREAREAPLLLLWLSLSLAHLSARPPLSPSSHNTGDAITAAVNPSERPEEVRRLCPDGARAPNPLGGGGETEEERGGGGATRAARESAVLRACARQKLSPLSACCCSPTRGWDLTNPATHDLPHHQ